LRQLPPASEEELQALGVLLDVVQKLLGRQLAELGLQCPPNTIAMANNAIVWKDKIEASEEIEEKPKAGKKKN